jgi:hypothetical protein
LGDQARAINFFLRTHVELFDIKIGDLLNGHEPHQAYRKVIPEGSGEAKKMDAHT